MAQWFCHQQLSPFSIGKAVVEDVFQPHGTHLYQTLLMYLIEPVPARSFEPIISFYAITHIL